MAKEKMSIHKGLAELKIIDDRITKAIQTLIPVGIMQKKKLVDELYQKEDFEKDAKAKLQSIQDLILRKTLIKSAIVAQNAVTKVTVAGQEMTIADAINFKEVVKFNKMLVAHLKKESDRVKGKYITKNENVFERGLENAKIMLGKEDEKVKPTDKDVEAIMKPFIERYEFHLVDPLEVEKFIEGQEEKISKFELEVDAVLSEINAVTIITI